MKKTLWIILAVLAYSIPYSHGQGQFVFVNRMVGFFDAPFYLQGTTMGAGTLGNVEVQLWTRDGASMLAESTFRASSGIQAAYIFPVDVIVEGNTGQPIDVELRFLLNGALLNSPESDFTFMITPAAPPNPPARIGGYEGGLQSLPIIPEPSTIALAVLGMGAFLLRRRKKLSN